MPLKTLVVGIGSTILSDDGVGVRVVEALRAVGLPDDVDTLEVGTAGLSMLDLVAGYDRLIVVDASHEADLPTTLALGEELPGLEMPGEVVVIAVETADLTTFSEDLTSAVADAIDDAAAAVHEVISAGIPG